MHEDHRSGRANACLDTAASLDQINQSMLGEVVRRAGIKAN